MKLHLKVKGETDESTLSELYVDGRKFCYVLEDGYNKEKIYGETRIPHGVYPIELRKSGKHYWKYKKRYNHNHTFHVRYVANYGYIMIHIGNTVENTLGCLLVGKYHTTDEEGDHKITHSTISYKQLYKVMTLAAQKGRDIVISVDRSGSKYEEQEPINQSKVYDV